MKKNNCKYWVMIIVGAVATMLSILNIWVCDTWKIILNIAAMFGSGVFCSAIVSLAFEKSNERKLLEEQRCNREYFYSYLAFKLESIIIDELKLLCEYLGIKYSLNNEFEEGIGIDEAIKTIRNLYNKIKTTHYDNQKNNRELINFCKNYEDLAQVITPLLQQNTLFVFTNTISKDGANCLSQIYRYSNSIVNQIKNEKVDSVIELKLGFFEEVNVLLSIIVGSFDSLILNFKIEKIDL